MATQFEVVEPSRPRPPQLGLLASVTPQPLGDREAGGLTWVPAPCGTDTATFDPSCGIDPNLDGDNSGTVEDAPQAQAVGLVTRDTCSTFSPAVGVAARAQLAMELATSRLLEDELWTGARAVSAGFDNPFLRNSSGLTELNSGTATAYLRALADLEQALADGRAGGRGYICATRRTVTLWYASGALYRSGAMLLTGAADSIVISGEGFDGSAPNGTVDSDGSSAWAYAVAGLEVRLGAITVNDPDSPLLTSSNTRTATATRLAVVTFDPCVRAGVNVNHCGLAICA